MDQQQKRNHLVDFDNNFLNSKSSNQCNPFTYKGRLGRIRYFTYIALNGLISFALFVALIVMVWFWLYDYYGVIGFFWLGIILVALVCNLVLMTFILLKLVKVAKIHEKIKLCLENVPKTLENLKTCFLKLVIKNLINLVVRLHQILWQLK